MRVSDHCCPCLAAGVHCGVFLCEGRCTESQHTGLAQRALNYLAQRCAYRDGGRGGGGQSLSTLEHARSWSLACHVLCCALRGVTRLSDHCCACLAAGVHCGVLLCEGRCTESQHTGLSQRAFPKGEAPSTVPLTAD